MTRREFLKKSVWLLLTIPFIGTISKWISSKTSHREAMYYKELAG